MMINRHWVKFGAMFATACILAGCGGDDGPSMPSAWKPHQATPTTPSLPSLSQDDHSKPSSYSDWQSRDAQLNTPGFDGKEMEGFVPPVHNAYVYNALKFMISAVGPQNLVDHLQQVGKTATDLKKRLCAEKLIEVIEKFYNSQMTLSGELRDLVHALQALPPFDEVNENGAAKYNLTGREPVPEFTALLAQAFQFDALPGWTLHSKTTWVRGDEKRVDDEKNNFHIHHFSNTIHLNNGYSKEITLQQTVDMYNRNMFVETRWNETDQALSEVKLSNEISVDDIENFKRLTINPLSISGAALHFNLDDRVELRVFDQKTQKHMVLTLEPKDILMARDNAYRLLMKNTAGAWRLHDGLVVKRLTAPDLQGTVMLLNLGVVNVTPA